MPFRAPQTASLLYLREDELRKGIEMLFFGYRDFVGEVDEVLREIGFGRAHHRVLHFVARHPGMTVGELLAILKITKQSLSRVLRELVETGHIAQRKGTYDRRQRLLELTDKGRALEGRLFALQRARIAKAFREAGPEAVAGFRKVLMGLFNEADRAMILKTVESP